MKQVDKQDFSSSDVKPLAKKNKWGIRGRIAAAFVIVSLMTLITGIIAAFTYNGIDESMNRIEDSGIRISALAFSLARHTTEAARDYGSLLASSDIETFSERRGRFDAELNDLSQELASLKVIASEIPNPPDLEPLEQSIKLLTTKVDPIVSAMERKLTMTREINRVHQLTNDAYNELTATLAPISENKKEQLISALKGAGGTNTAQTQTTNPQSDKQERIANNTIALAELHIAIDQANATMSEVRLVPDLENVSPLLDKFESAANRAREALNKLSEKNLALQIEPKLEKFLAYGEGLSGLFQAKKAKLALVRDAPNLIAQNRTYMQRLVNNAEETAKVAAAHSKEAVDDARTAIDTSRNFITVLVLSSFAFSLLFAWYYVGEGMIKRLLRINSTTRELAEGNLDVEIPHTGDDEIEDIAQALEIFKANAISARDLENEKEQARKIDLQGREASFRFLFKRNPIPMWVYELESKRFLSVNESAIKHYGYTRDEFLSKTIYALKSANDKSSPEEFEQGMRYGTKKSESSTHSTACGNSIDVVTYCRELIYEGNNACLVATIDVTERNEAQARVAHMALHDSLTELANRNKFNDHLEQALNWIRRNKNEGVAVHCLDLDRFKIINDTLGHATGDAVLKVVAKRLIECVREIDTVARMGGDEFAIIQRQIRTPSAPHVLAKRIVDSVRQPFDFNGASISVGASIGIAQAPTDGSDAEQLLTKADLALYRAKSGGCGNYRFFKAEMGEQLEQRQRMEVDLKRAMEEDQIDLLYQPIFSADTKKVTAFEAILRWRHPTNGILEAVDFVPLAKESGLIVPIGTWALKEACKQAAKWPESKKLAISVHKEQLQSGDLQSVILEALSDSGLPPNRLELELTQSVAALKVRSVTDALNSLRSQGVSFIMDDFCNGQSTLDQVRQFKFEKVNIETSFISEMKDQGDGKSILRSIIKLARSMHFETLAKGVETNEQLNVIRSERCTEMQGKLFAKPMMPDELEKFTTEKSQVIRGAA